MVASLLAVAAVLLAAGTGTGKARGGSAAASAPASPAVEFERARNAFARAEYGRAVDLLRPLLYPEVRLESEGEVVQAHRMLGVASLFEGRPEEARREFRKLLELRPDYRFDPLLDPPRVVDFFNVLVKEEEAELAVIESKRRAREQELALRRQREAEKLQAPAPTIVRVERHSYVLNFVPFGAGQFQNGQARKGWFFLGTEAVLGGASLAFFATNFAVFGVAPVRACNAPRFGDTPSSCPPDQVDHTDENLSRNLVRAQVITGGLFFAVAIWGVVDALRHYQRDVLISPAPNGLSVAARF
jgi:hypothetical protein